MSAKRTACLTTLLVVCCTAGAPAQTTYLPGFTWDWRVDFGEPASLAEAPPNPNSDAAGRAAPANAGLSSGPQVAGVWQYGNAPHSSLTGGTYPIHLRVTDDLGASDVADSSLYIVPEPGSMGVLVMGVIVLLRRRGRGDPSAGKDLPA